MHIDDLLRQTVEAKASDLHLTVGVPPMIRIWGKLQPTTHAALTPEDTFQLAYSMLNTFQKQKFEKNWELDLLYAVTGLGRFRVNVYRQRGSVGVASRVISENIPSVEELNIPMVMKDLCRLPRGLILVTGPTGHGKSTTLAAMVDFINAERAAHIMTIEDPIEYVHAHKKSIVNQRELGFDTQTFPNALRAVLREDPNVVLVGEMRDLEPIAAALTIAETGHLAFATLHTNSAMESINRIIDVFPSHQQAQVRAQLSFVLEGVITQTLLQKAKGRGRVMACEILIMTPAVRALIRDQKIEQIPSMMQAGKKHRMQTPNDALYQLYVGRQVTKDGCLRATSTPNEFLRIVGEAPLDDREPLPSGGQPAVGACKVAARR